MNMIYQPTSLSTAFNQVFGDSWLGLAREREPFFSPSVDIREEEDAVLLQAEIPGVSQNDLSIDLKEGVLTIHGEKKLENENAQGSTHSERFFGKFKRSFHLGKMIDPESIEANYANGVLNLRLGKLPQAQPKRIEVAFESKQSN